MSLNLHLLRLFATVAEIGSFSRAAAVLRLSQPAISKGVRDFELQLGCRLLDRSHKGVKPTREGLALARHAKSIFAAEGAAEQELKSLRGLDSGSLRIGASTTIATYLLPEYLGEFHRAHPGIDLHLASANTRDIADLMHQHEIEIALVEGPVEDDGLISEPWQTDVMTLITAPSHPFGRTDQPIDPARLTKELLVIREPGSGSREVVNQLLSLHAIQPSRTLEIGSTEAIKQLVAAGLGISIVSAAAVKDQVSLHRLKMIEIAGIRLERTLWQLKVPGRMSIPAADVFEKLIKRKPGTEPRFRSTHSAKVLPRAATAVQRRQR
jgi:DNA-binding transcriptional LysR family regulator